MSTVKSNHFHLVDDIQISAMAFALVETIDSLFARAATTLQVWAARSRDRRQLSYMTTHMLDDIGINRIDVARETSKHFWQK